MEYDDERSGSFEPLKHVPEDKFVALGLVTTKRPELESVDSLSRRVTAAARHLQLDRLGLSPQCGFASSIMGNRVSAAAQWKKLQLVVTTARALWGEDVG